VLRRAIAAPAYAERLKGIDPSGITSRAAAGAPAAAAQIRLPELHKASPPSADLSQGAQARSGACYIARPDI